MGKKVGDSIKVFASNYEGCDFECTIVGEFPGESRWSKSSCMRLDYFFDTLDVVKPAPKGLPEIRPVNLIWVRMPDKPSYELLAAKVNDPKVFNGPQAKMETATAAIGSFLDVLKDILWGMERIVSPAIVGIMCLVITITITIGVRERRTEMAVMKVMGFLPWQIMTMIVAEAVLIGFFGGTLSTGLVTFVPRLIKWAQANNIKLPGTFFSKLEAPIELAVIGPMLGTLVGLIGAAIPAWGSRKVKVSEVFAQVS